nr:LysR family transcriptional regulator [Frankia sp. Cppng1_Ct_nod]
MTFPTINTAADHLGADQAALVRQFRRLERDIGAPLFYRATHAQPMRPTPRGQALLRALTRPEIRAHMTNAKKK